MTLVWARGIVPDGVKAVTLLNVDGTTKQIEAVSNGFEATVGPEARSVSWVDPATGATITAPVTTST